MLLIVDTDILAAKPHYLAKIQHHLLKQPILRKIIIKLTTFVQIAALKSKKVIFSAQTVALNSIFEFFSLFTKKTFLCHFNEQSKKNDDNGQNAP